MYSVWGEHRPSDFTRELGFDVARLLGRQKLKVLTVTDMFIEYLLIDFKLPRFNQRQTARVTIFDVYPQFVGQVTIELAPQFPDLAESVLFQINVPSRPEAAGSAAVGSGGFRGQKPSLHKGDIASFLGEIVCHGSTDDPAADDR